uniref:Uncharacterized protein n=1 Tax=Glossina pallidipes TaxID=7398 RepID=A0A1A9Z390_GLOPL
MNAMLIIVNCYKRNIADVDVARDSDDDGDNQQLSRIHDYVGSQLSQLLKQAGRQAGRQVGKQIGRKILVAAAAAAAAATAAVTATAAAAVTVKLSIDKCVEMERMIIYKNIRTSSFNPIPRPSSRMERNEEFLPESF